MPEPGIPAGEEQFRDARGVLLRRLWFVGGLVGVLVGAVTLALWLQPDPPGPLDGLGAEEEDIEQALAVVNPGYVGIEVCAECHAPRAAVVKTSRHYLACRPATEGVTAKGFAPGRGTHETRVPGLHFEMTRTGNDYFVTRVDATTRGEQRVPYQIGLVYGSAGKHDETYFAWRDDRLYHLPVSWLHPYERWGQAAESIVPPETHSACVECHNTWVAHVPGTVNQFRRDDMHLGVTCERCHGPGREHAEHHRTHPNSPAHAILHPGTLSRERLMDVCAQCHAHPKRFGRAFSYRPGEPFDAFFHNYKPTNPEDDTTNQVRYLRESKCFQKSQMTCIDCHDPHRLDAPQGGCLNCHAATACTDHPRLPAAVRGDCVGCHMPSRIWTHAHLYTTTDDEYVPLAPRADHRIGVYPEVKKAVLLAWLRKQNDAESRAEADRLVGQLTQYWMSEADRRRRAGRIKAETGALREALRIAPDATIRQQLQEAIKLQSELDGLSSSLRNAGSADAAIPILTRMLEINPNSAKAHGDLGTVYATTGRGQKALAHLQAVAKYEPSDAYGVIRLAEMAYREGRSEEAAVLCAQANEINPESPLNRNLWGLVFLKLERWPDAETQFRRVLLGNPTHWESNGGLSEALRHQGQVVEAVRFARRAVHWSKGQNAVALLTLADAYSAAGCTVDARATLERALPVAERSNVALAPTIRARLIELK